ncbi:transposase family protein [Lunatimonas lonarensis]|uniref:transposase family protein n=1 Tax=Lunatimonas lonarensis TaxID=1232681 RepID=UPI0012DF783F
MFGFFGRENPNWFRRYFPYRKRTPSHDTLRCFFETLDTGNLGEVLHKQRSMPNTEVI